MIKQISIFILALHSSLLTLQQYRPNLHYTPSKNWMNDPNGLFYDFSTDEYNLYYQYNPFGSKWGHMSWGHATSNDLVTWKQHPVAIQEQDGIMIFSGSAIKIFDNSTVVAFYTGMDTNRLNIQQQSIAFSYDNGMTFSKYQNNPVLDIESTNFRDPKVYWHQQLEMYIMAVVKSDEYIVQFYGAKQVTDKWRLLSEFGNQGAVGGVWECPDLFKLPVIDINDLNQEKYKWVLIVNINPGGPNLGSAAQYFVGSFNENAEFIKQSGDQVLWLDYGHDFYAASSWNQSPDGKLLIAWANNWRYANDIPTQVWRGAMTLPRELYLWSRQQTNGEIEYRVQSKVTQRFQESWDRSTQINVIKRSFDQINKDIAESLDGRGHFSQLQLDLLTPSFSIKLLSNDKGDKFVKIGCSYQNTSINCYVDRTHSGNCSFNKAFCDQPAEGSIVAKDKFGECQVRIIIDVSVIEFYFTITQSDGFQRTISFVERVFIPDIQNQNMVLLEYGEGLIGLKTITLRAKNVAKFE